MDTILKQSLLYDFYGELLTNHQKEVYEQFVLEDLSLSEIAQSAGISRQGVHDMVRRCQKTLEGYETKLHLVERFLIIKEQVRQIDVVLDEYEQRTVSPENMAVRIREISDRIIEEL
ncbi:MAG: DNA-binding protein [Schaedlerella sp.]|nr:DNA-binding protein [Schaedlerella sp.]